MAMARNGAAARAGGRSLAPLKFESVVGKTLDEGPPVDIPLVLVGGLARLRKTKKKMQRGSFSRLINPSATTDEEREDQPDKDPSHRRRRRQGREWKENIVSFGRENLGREESNNYGRKMDFSS